jgi:polar amino acid transport system substrate-binding protein
MPWRTTCGTSAPSVIEATYLVPAESSIGAIDEVDREGVRIAVSARSAYELWLSDHIEHAELVMANGLDASFDLFEERKLDALAGLRPKLMTDVEKLPGARILDGKFTAVQQAVGARPGGVAGAAFLRDFVEEAKSSGLIASLIEKHGVSGQLTVAPAA